MNSKNMILVFSVLVFVIFFALWFRRIDYQNDPNNCGAKDNLCDVGYVCKNATCIKP